MSDVKNLTDVKEFLETLGLGALEPKLSQELTLLAESVNTLDRKGTVTMKISFEPHKKEDYIIAKTQLTVEKPKVNGVGKDVTNFKDIFKISEEEGVEVLSPSEASELTSF